MSDNSSSILRRLHEIISVIGLDSCEELLLSTQLRQMPYRTTNELFLLGSYVFKRYASKKAYLTERTIYINRNIFSFKTPTVRGFCEDSHGDGWLVMEYIDGLNLIEYLSTRKPDSSTCKACVINIVKAISEFEAKASNLLEIGSVELQFFNNIAPLIQLLREQGYSTGLNRLESALIKANNFLQVFSKVPCFDAYPRNIIVVSSDNVAQNYLPKLLYCDFDKADRLIPVGEQLSHIIINDVLGNYRNYAVEAYTEACGLNQDHIEQVLSVCLFIRTLSGVRDSLRWLPKTIDDSVSAKSTLERLRNAKWCLTRAMTFLEDFTTQINSSTDEKSLIEQLLKEIFTRSEVMDKRLQQIWGLENV